MGFELYLYKTTDFFNAYLSSLLILGMIFFSSFFFYYSWRNSKDKKRDLFVSIVCTLFAIFVLFSLVIPKTLDITHLIKGEFAVIEGPLEKVSSVRSESSNDTLIVVNEKRFILEEDLMYLNEYIGQTVNIQYLPNSNQVIQVQIFYEKQKIAE